MTMMRPRSHLGIGKGDPAVPGPGEENRIRIPDTFAGIKREVNRMKKIVKEASGDTFVRGATEVVLTSYGVGTLDDDKRVDASIVAVYDWAKKHYAFTNDPISRELVKHPRKMLRELADPADTLRSIMGNEVSGGVMGNQMEVSADYLQNLNQIAHPACFDLNGQKVCPAMRGDCDDAATLLAGMLASVGIEPRFALGGATSPSGKACEWHHVWMQGNSSLGWVDMDITRSEFQLGDAWPHFECVETVSIF